MKQLKHQINSMVKYIDKIFSDELALLKNKKIHIICQADISNDSHVERYRKEAFDTMKRASLEQYINATNDKKEASTLYPIYYLSLYPKVTIDSEEKFRTEFYTFFKDLIVLGNEKYLRSDTILFVFEKEHLE